MKRVKLFRVPIQPRNEMSDLGLFNARGFGMNAFTTQSQLENLALSPLGPRIMNKGIALFGKFPDPLKKLCKGFKLNRRNVGSPKDHCSNIPHHIDAAAGGVMRIEYRPRWCGWDVGNDLEQHKKTVFQRGPRNAHVPEFCCNLRGTLKIHTNA